MEHGEVVHADNVQVMEIAIILDGQMVTLIQILLLMLWIIRIGFENDWGPRCDWESGDDCRTQKYLSAWTVARISRKFISK